MRSLETLDVDVCVIGLGPAGASAAAAAARAGRRVLAIDRKSEPGLPVQCAEFVPSMIQTEVGDLAHAVRQPNTGMLTFVDGEIPHVTDNFPGRMIDRAAFDAALVRSAVEAGADCRSGIAISGLDPEGCVVAAGDARISARVVIGADGPRSRIGKGIGRVNRSLVETRQITVPLRRSQTSTDIFLSADMIGGYGWLFPKGMVANLGIGVVPEHKHRLKRLLDDLHGRLAGDGIVGREIIGYTGGAIPVGGMLDAACAVADRLVLLAGDAAGLANPVTGAGINAAVVSGRLAGEAAARRLDGTADAGHDYAEELADLYKPSLERALSRRLSVLDRYDDGGRPAAADLRGAWIAYPQYWEPEVRRSA
jgi:geranylgeranyl reductase family protein